MSLHGIKTATRGLRIVQAKSVMPMIGPLLDAWEALPNDELTHLREVAPELCRRLDLIDNAMETALSAEVADLI